MKINEFKERVKDLGYLTCTDKLLDEFFVIQDIDDIWNSETLVSISTVAVGEIRVHRKFFKLDKKDREQLLLLAYALADTEIDERGDL